MKKAFFFSLIFLSFIISCKKEYLATSRSDAEQKNTAVIQANDDSLGTKEYSDSAQFQPRKEVVATPKLPNSADAEYSFFAFPKDKKDSAVAAFNKKYSAPDRAVILALNRLDKKNARNADTLVIPNKIDSTMMAYSPFPPQVESLKDIKKIVIFSYPIQAFALYTNGVLEKWGPTSMGKKATPTQTGLTFANWKKELSISTVSDEWKLPYNFNIYNNLGIGWHQYDLPGYPASHSCLRLLEKDAKYLYHYANQWILEKGGATTKAKGTPVIIFGEYPWGERKPWRNLIENPRANDISAEELEQIVNPYREKILAEQEKREQVIASMPPKISKTDSLSSAKNLP